MIRFATSFIACVVAGCALGSPEPSIQKSPKPLSSEALAQIIFDQKLGKQVSLDLMFRDEEGKAVTLKDYFGKKPIILVPGYYGCPMLCSMVLNGLVETLQDMKWKVGEQFVVVNFSINPRETWQLAAAKKHSYIRRYGRTGAENGWHFLTGEERAVHQLADDVGFRYAYDPVSKEYAHPSGFVVLTPNGSVSRYFFGVSHVPTELYGALSEAAVNRTGSPIQQLFYLCFHYNPIRGKYGRVIMTVLRVAGFGTVLGLSCLVFFMVRVETARKKTRFEAINPALDQAGTVSAQAGESRS
jgi:protein SCO1/2